MTPSEAFISESQNSPQRIEWTWVLLLSILGFTVIAAAVFLVSDLVAPADPAPDAIGTVANLVAFSLLGLIAGLVCGICGLIAKAVARRLNRSRLAEVFMTAAGGAIGGALSYILDGSRSVEVGIVTVLVGGLVLAGASVFVTWRRGRFALHPNSR